jgi:hypothetical protein
MSFRTFKSKLLGKQMQEDHVFKPAWEKVTISYLKTNYVQTCDPRYLGGRSRSITI